MTEIRTELSEKNPYRIPKERYLELKHYCLQYSDWVEQRSATIKLFPNVVRTADIKTSRKIRPTESAMEHYAYWQDRIDDVNELIYDIFPGDSLNRSMLKLGVTKGLTYEKIVAQMEEFPRLTRQEYYLAYRKFFWLLDKRRDPHE